MFKMTADCEFYRAKPWVAVDYAKAAAKPAQVEEAQQ